MKQGRGRSRDGDRQGGGQAGMETGRDGDEAGMGKRQGQGRGRDGGEGKWEMRQRQGQSRDGDKAGTEMRQGWGQGRDGDEVKQEPRQERGTEQGQGRDLPSLSQTKQPPWAQRGRAAGSRRMGCPGLPLAHPGLLGSRCPCH